MKISAEGIVKIYGGRRVVDQVSFHVEKGEIVGLLGPNGAGKTTSFNILTGLVRANGGKVFLDGQDLSGLPMHRRARLGVNYLPQESSVFRKLSVEDNLLAILETRKLSRSERKARAEQLMEEFKITHLRKSPAYALSGGERRRVEIARALTSDPHFLLLDEPFAGIDPITVEDIQSMIAALRDKGMGILITDHNVRETLAITARAYIIFEGRVLIEGTAAHLANDEEARRIYLGTRFTL